MPGAWTGLFGSVLADRHLLEGLLVVHIRDLVRVLLADSPAFPLHSRRRQPVLLGELLGHEPELLDLFVFFELLVDALYLWATSRRSSSSQMAAGSSGIDTPFDSANQVTPSTSGTTRALTNFRSEPTTITCSMRVISPNVSSMGSG